MTLALATLAGLLLLELLWNVAVPYVLFFGGTGGRDGRGRGERGRGGADGGGVSLMPGVELALLAALVVVAAVSDGAGRLHEPGWVAFVGGLAIGGSHAHAVLIFPLVARLAARRGRK